MSRLDKLRAWVEQYRQTMADREAVWFTAWEGRRWLVRTNPSVRRRTHTFTRSGQRSWWLYPGYWQRVRERKT